MPDFLGSDCNTLRIAPQLFVVYRENKLSLEKQNDVAQIGNDKTKAITRHMQQRSKGILPSRFGKAKGQRNP